MKMNTFDYAIVVASDSRSLEQRKDLCIDVVKNALGEEFSCRYEKIISDDKQGITDELLYLCDEEIPLIITSGGTGFSPRDNTPEATMAVIERPTPGLSEALRLISLEKTPFGMLSRGVSGIRSKSLIINLPGSPKAVKESLEGIKGPLIHGLEILLGLVGEHKSN
ncbi:MAG: MogA/MoaB family molybdenum cofactor biosynthesis protein [Tissierellia bacterium]|nr:MogA/MoaB family molybdenum cofactor biosynthesis protein [Tissierellia bacterium]